MTTRSWRGGRVRTLAPPVLFTAVAVALGWVQNDFQLYRSAGWLIFGLLALSLDLVWGQVGIFSFGQTAFFGIAGYAYGTISINSFDRTGESTTAILGAVAIAAVVAAVLGYFMFYGRVSDVYLAIITLAFTLVLLTFFGSTADPRYHVGSAQLGGYNGMNGVLPLILGIPTWRARFLTVQETYLFLALLAGGIYLLLVLLLGSPFGRVLHAVRENELRTELLGYDTRRYKLLAFALGGAIAGLAGALFAGRGYFISPSVFTLTQAALVVIWVLVGGRGTLLGAFLGVVVVEYLSGELGGRTANTPLFLGGILILFVLLIPNGLMSAASALWGRLRERRDRTSLPAAAIAPAGRGATGGNGTALPPPALDGAGSVVLETRDLSVSFGGVKAVDGISVRFGGGMHCLIGPNGAGKSTFFNLLIGRYRPSGGRILYLGDDIARLERHERARRGIGIKLQVPSVYGRLGVEENLWLAAYARLRDAKRATVRAREVLAEVGLHSRAGDLAAHLSHGEQQWLEIGMVLAAEPRLILLDEPTAGMTREETAQTVALVTALAAHTTVVVVEHDMEFVRQLRAPVTVLHQGRIFKQGSLDELRGDDEVLDIYLGRQTHVAH
ncbi:MAG TPA: ATP-binding cassette domain-containing protein [Thermomicrobiales bacterium]